MFYLNRVIHSDALSYLKSIPDNTFNCCVTSPPYFGLRKYTESDREIGVENSIFDYVDNLVIIFRELRRTLRDDGVFWLNLGDSYAANRSYQVNDTKWGDVGNHKRSQVPEGLKPKDLIGIPWRVAFALQADGWYLRSAMPWIKTNPMPESVQDRPVNGHEYVFLFSKSDKYLYDAFATRKRAKVGYNGSTFTEGRTAKSKEFLASVGQKDREEKSSRSYRTTDMWFDSINSYVSDGGILHDNDNNPIGITSSVNRHDWEYCNHCNTLYVGKERKLINKEGKNKYCVCGSHTSWVEHFASFPTTLVEPLILAGCPECVCGTCSIPYNRLIDHSPMEIIKSDRGDKLGKYGKTSSSGKMVKPAEYTHVGWEPSCDCIANVVGGIVVDPFAGSGTTLRVAQSLGRQFAGCDLNEDYVKVANALLGVQKYEVEFV